MLQLFAKLMLSLLAVFSVLCISLPSLAKSGADTIIYGTSIDTRNWLRLRDLHTGLDIEIFRAGDINLTNLYTNSSGVAMFITVEDLRWRLHLMDVITGAVRVIADEPRIDDAVWSPDGQQIAYWVGGRNPFIRIIDTNGTMQHTLNLPTGWRNYLSWHPDGDSITYWHRTETDYDLLALDIDTQTSQRIASLADFPDVDQPPQSAPLWLNPYTFIVADHDCNLHQLDLMTTTATRIETRDTCLPHISPDQSMLIYSSVLIEQQSVRRIVMYLFYQDGREPRIIPRWDLTSRDAIDWWSP